MSKKNPAIIKRDLRIKWLKSNYVPDKNVIIIMDNDDGTISLMIGDGECNVNALPDLLLSTSSNLQQVQVDNNVLIL